MSDADDDDFDPWADFAGVEAEVAAATHMHAERDREIVMRARRKLATGESVDMERHVPQIPDPRHYRSGLTQERTAFRPWQFAQNWRDGYR